MQVHHDKGVGERFAVIVQQPQDVDTLQLTKYGIQQTYAQSLLTLCITHELALVLTIYVLIADDKRGIN